MITLGSNEQRACCTPGKGLERRRAPRTPRPNGRPSRLAGIAALVFAIGAVAGCSRGGNEGYVSNMHVPVLVAKAVRKTVADEIHAIGKVEAHSTVDIKAQINGQVLEVHFHEGQDVKKGDLLFTIDPRPYQAALLQAQANLAKDQAQLAQAKADYERYAYLLKKRVGSQQQYDQALAAYQGLKASVAADEAAVQTAQVNLSYTRIHSPIDGRTGNLIVHAGNLVKANADTAMVTINQIRPVYVDFSIPEKDLDQVRANMAEHPLPVFVTTPTDKDERERGYLSFIDNQVDSTTGTILLKGTFKNANERLWPGQFVNVTLIVRRMPDQVVVPSQAVQTGQDGSYVFVVGEKMKAEMRKVVLGATVGGDTVVARGLKAGETVVTDGQLRLVPGATVIIKQGLEPRQAAS
jgi:multidrug efflux system membrane fusion protein